EPGTINRNQFTRRNRPGKIARSIRDRALRAARAHGLEHADGIVPGIREINRAILVERNSPGSIDRSQCRSHAIARITAPAVAADRGDDSVATHLPYAVLARVGNVNGARAIHCNSAGRLQGGAGRLIAVAEAAESVASRHRSDRAVRGHLANAVVAFVNYVQ